MSLTGEIAILWPPWMSWHWLTHIGRHGVAKPQKAEHYDKFERDYSDED